MITPIFIVGTPRSGTTWLSNILSMHSRVACVQQRISDKLGGVNESAFFSYVDGKFGSLKNNNNLIQLIEVFSSSTFFILSGIDKTVFYKKRPQTYSDFFRLLMDQLADKQGADFWLEKTPSHTFHLKEISKYYPNAKFIVMRRNVVDQIKSFIKMNEVISGVKTRDLSFLRKKVEILVRHFKYFAHVKHCEYFIANNPNKIFEVDYEHLRDSTERVMQELCCFLGIDYEVEMLGQEYAPNTGFRSNDGRSEILSQAEVRGIQILHPLMKLLPYRMHRLIYLAKRSLAGRSFPYWFFSYNIEKHGWSNIFGKGHDRAKHDTEV